MLRLLLMLVTCLSCVLTCPYPDDLIGEWYSTSFGTLTFTSTSFSGFTSAGVSANALTFTCYGRDGDKYVSRYCEVEMFCEDFLIWTSVFYFSSTVSLFDATVSYYLCMNLVRISSIKYYFTLDSNLDVNGVRFLLSTSQSVTVAEACSFTDTRSAGEYELLILKACPGSFQSFYNVTMDTSTSTNCENSTMDGSSGNALSYNYSSCVSSTLNSGGTLQCLYNVVSGDGYLITYNNDTTTDETSTFRFTCYTYSKVAAILNATEHPRSCHSNQSTTYVNSPGITYTMTDIYYVAPKEDKENNLGLILGLVFGIIALIVLIAVGIILYRKYCRKEPEPPPPPKIRKKKRKLSVTDYSPNVTARGVPNQKEFVKKQSAEEILTGSLLNERNMPDLDKEAGYEPLKKEKWQKQWESTPRASTPMKPTSMGGRSVYGGQNGLVIHENEPLSMKSSSLPDHLDSSPRVSYDSPRKSVQKDNIKIEALDLETPRSPSPRYSERSHSTPRLPESTGKFGGHSTFRSDGTIFMPNSLQTIKENPFSRENTEILKEQVPKTPKTIGAFSRPYSSLTASQSTVSAGDVRLGSLSKSSRYSHMSASNESIFDDPRWMTQSVTESENAFEVGKNLLPGLPKKSVLDQKAFLKIPATVSREDFDYSKSKNMRSVGIKASSTQSNMPERSHSSQKIIEDEKKRRKKKGETTKPKISWIYRWENVLRPQSPFRSIVSKRRPTVTPSDDADRLSDRTSKTFDDIDADINASRSSLTPSYCTGMSLPDHIERPRSATSSTLPDITLTTPDDLNTSIAETVSLGNMEDTYSLENETSDRLAVERIGRKRKRHTKTKEFNIHLDLITGQSDDGTGSRSVSRSSSSQGRSLGTIKLLIVNEGINGPNEAHEEAGGSELVPMPVNSPNGDAIFKLRTSENVDAISVSLRSNISVDEVTVDESIASSYYSEVFLPDDWLFMYSEDHMVEDYWDQGSKRMSKKRKQEVKCWLKSEPIDKRRKKTENN